MNLKSCSKNILLTTFTLLHASTLVSCLTTYGFGYKIGHQENTAELGKSVMSLGKIIQNTCCMRTVNPLHLAHI